MVKTSYLVNSKQDDSKHRKRNIKKKYKTEISKEINKHASSVQVRD